MNYINNESVRCLLFVFLLSLQACGQGFDADILNRSESYQRQFVTDYLRDGNTNGFVKGYPTDRNHNTDFQLITMEKKWALELTEHRLNEWMSESEVNRTAIENVSNTIIYASTIESFDVLARVFSKRAELRRWIVQSLLTKFGAPEPNGFSKFYHALEYRDITVREIARETFISLMKQPLTENLYTVWGAALVERYKHEPTSMEILQDPILEIARRRNPEGPELMSQRLVKATKEIYAKRKHGLSKEIR